MIATVESTQLRHRKKPGATCAHIKYGLTCDDYEALWGWAGNRCQICGIGSQDGRRGLSVDHDHHRGDWAVRGILCSKCNTHVGKFEKGVRLASNEMRAYLSNPWVDIHFTAEQIRQLDEPPLFSTIKVEIGRHRVWVRRGHGWEVLSSSSSYDTSKLTWSKLNHRYGPHRIVVLGTSKTDPVAYVDRLRKLGQQRARLAIAVKKNLADIAAEVPLARAAGIAQGRIAQLTNVSRTVAQRNEPKEK